MQIEIPTQTIFYTIEKAIKGYRKFSQKNISSSIKGITIDQTLVLQFLDKHPELSQKEIAELIYKDNASMTRMVNIMVKKEYIKRTINENDRRRFKLEITSKGQKVLTILPKIIASNRSNALENVSEDEVLQLEKILNKIINNCNK
ncbi:MAG: DNA-binding MarR family transcriptional regulator [Polaribacter sp.]|jgi:DNA-binding MarR family transcriptional regulator